VAKGPKRQPKGDHVVGYCRPPEDTRFKKGEKQNHNPRRQRAADHDVGGYIQEELAKLVSVDDGQGRRRKMPMAKVLAKQMVNQAVKTGDARRLREFLPKIAPEAQEPFTEAELETIARFLETFTRKTGQDENE
jgi:hypothetical protein